MCTLLLVDDDENILSSLRRLLRRDGYRLLTADSGQAGLDVLARETVDVIVSDQRMPGMTGTEFLRVAAERHPETVRIVLSGYTELQSVTAAINEGAVFKFLTKPWDDGQLRANIADAVRRKRFDDDNRRLQQELADANRQLRELLAERQVRIAIGENTLQIAQETIAALPVAIVGVDEDGIVVLANQAAQTLLANPLVGLPARLILPPDCFDNATPAPAARPALRVLRSRLSHAGQARGEVFAFIPPFSEQDA